MTNFSSDEYISGSNQKAKNGYGQNGYQGASSIMPGQPHVTSGFLPQGSVPSDNWQTRNVSNERLAAAHGQKGPKTGETIPAKTNRR
jgi:hypothetical protein